MNQYNEPINEIADLFSLSGVQQEKKSVSLEKVNSPRGTIKVQKQSNLIKSKAEIKRVVFEAINQFYGISVKPCTLRNLSHTDLTMLVSIWNSLIDKEKDFKSRIILLVYIFILETALNHIVLVKAFLELQKTSAQTDFRKSCGTVGEISNFDFESVKPFQPISQEDIKSLYEWYGRQLLNPKLVNNDAAFVEFVPNIMLPSFNAFRVLSDSQKSLVKTFMAIAAKRIHQTRMFMTHNKVKNFMEYSDFITDYLNRFKHLSINKKAESQFNFSCTFSEKFKVDENLEFLDVPGALSRDRKMMSFSEKQTNRPRFKSETLRYGLQPIPTSTKKLSNRNTLVHVQRESSKEVEAEPQKCSFCQSQVNGLFWMCSKCFHGGHLNHMNRWFKENSNCAKCFNCKCRE